MSQDYKSTIDEYRDNNPGGFQQDDGNPNYYPSYGGIRKFAFVWPDGKSEVFNYVSVTRQTFDPSSKDLTLELHTFKIVISGIKLDLLQFDMMAQLPKFILISDKRYNAVQDDDKDKYIVNEVNISEKQNG